MARIPVKIQERAGNVPSTQVWPPFLGLRRELDRLSDDFGRSLWQLPCGRGPRIRSGAGPNRTTGPRISRTH